MIKPITIIWSNLRWSNNLKAIGAPDYHARVHTLTNLRHTFSFFPAILSLNRSPNSNQLMTPDHHINTPLLFEIKPSVVFGVVFDLSRYRKPVKPFANRSFKASILSFWPSITNTITIIKVLSLTSTIIFLLFFP